MEFGDPIRASGGPAAGRETKVIFGDIHRIEPALDLPDWALDHTALMSAKGRERLSLLPCDRRLVAARGTIWQPTRGPERFIAELSVDNRSASVVDRTAFEETRVRLIYYPVWRLRYRYGGRLYGAVVDGVTGEIVYARAPQSDGHRVKWLIATAMVVSLFFGLASRWFWQAASWGLDSSLDLGTVVFVLYGVFFLVVALFAAAGWHQFRYPGEVVITGPEVDVVKVGASGDGMDAPWIRRVGDYINDVVEARHRDG
jgi:hypothetical protein